ncbi:hypothetical protein F5146DRAFT_1137044 [Armillaria mellea]|nr:hypothetical protein F5146DRAFT_1137044 [Armillaria mellea]
MSSGTIIASPDQSCPDTPIDMLPDETFLEIFTFGALSSGDASFSFLVSTICKSWRTFTIGEPRLWTNLIFTPTSAIELPPIPADFPFPISLVFPREALIIERSSDRDIDICIEYEDPEDEEEQYRLTEDHFLLLSNFLANHVAHRIRSFRVTTSDWPEIHQLCTKLHGIPLPRLQTCHLTAMFSEIKAAMDVYEQATKPVQLLEYDQGNHALVVTPQDLQTCCSVLYPALQEVCWSGLPMEWGRFCASDLRVLILQNQPSEERPSMETLRGNLSNSKDTLECLELTYAIGLDEEPGNPPPSQSRLKLPHVKKLKLIYIDPREAQQILRTFDFPALRTLSIDSHNEEEDHSTVLVDVLNYVRFEELLDLRLIGITLSPEDFSEQELNGADEESLPLILQFLCRFSCGNLSKLVLQCCCDEFLKFMNYRNDFGGGKNQSFRAQGFDCKGVYRGSKRWCHILRPVLEHMLLIVKPNVQEEAESLGDLKFVDDGTVFLHCDNELNLTERLEEITIYSSSLIFSNPQQQRLFTTAAMSAPTPRSKTYTFPGSILMRKIEI